MWWRIWGFLKLFRRDLIIMLLAMRNPATPKAVKGLFAVAVLYLISPVDLIPDTIPFLGMMDDAVIVPAASSVSTETTVGTVVSPLCPSAVT